MNYNIRPATETDLPTIFEMVRSLAEFDGELDGLHNTLENMQQDQDYFQTLVAEVDGQIIGMALYFYTYSTWSGKTLYLEDLFVGEPYRGHGIGSALLQAFIDIAKKENCQKVRWQVLDWNQAAKNFYQEKGASINTQWRNCDLNLNTQ